MTPSTSLRKRLRAALWLLRFGIRTGKTPAILAFTPIFPITAGLSYFAAREFLGALGAGEGPRLVVTAVVFVVLWLLSVVLGHAALQQRVTVGEAMGYEIDREVIRAAAALPQIDHLERPEYFDNLEVIRTQRTAIVQAPRVGGWLVDGSVGLLMSFLLLAATEPRLLFLLLAGVPPLVLNGRAQQRISQTQQAQAQRSRRALHYFDVATNPVAGKEMRTFGLAGELRRRHQEEWQERDQRLWDADVRAAAIRALGTLCSGVAFAVALAVMVSGVRRGDIDAGEIFLLLGIMTLVVGQLGGAANGLGSITRSLDVGQRLLWLMDAASEADQRQRSLTTAPPARLEHGLRFENVSFRYPGAAEDSIHDLTLDIPAGTVFAIVGENGAGKTTLVKLLFGFYQPTGGRILIDGQDLHELPQDAWRARTSACFQDHARFDLLARESIGIGDLARIDDTAAVSTAVNRAAAQDVIDDLPQLLDTQLGAAFGGAELSGGQWQRLAVSRAMMRDAPLLIALDEPTSAIDPLAEAQLLDRYATAAAEIGTDNHAVMVLISHRFSTVRMADRIAVLDNGQLTEHGTHEELMGLAGQYAELYTLQADSYR